MKRDPAFRSFGRWSRFGAATLVAMCLAASLPASAAAASQPTQMQRLVWNVACKYVAHGTVSAQVALVCTHKSPPSWDAGSQKFLQVLCERALRGTYERRAEYPTEYAACFFD